MRLTPRLTKPILISTLLLASACGRASFAASLPDAAVDEPRASAAAQETIVLAGGCFWGIEGVFDHVKGVTKATAGYTGGKATTADYETVSTGTTGHAESVEITYDPAQITLGQLLKIFFTVALDPTELNYQGPDHGTQYRSAIFTAAPEQQKIAAAYIQQLGAANSFGAPIVTEVTPLDKFYPAESYHQHYLQLHPSNPYIVFNDAPKVAALKNQLPAYYKD